MAHLRILVVLILAVLGYITIIDSAAVRSEEFGEVLERTALAMRPENLRSQRDADTSNENRSQICNKQPCGWAVYYPSTRQIDAFITNTCVCSDTTFKCVRTDDDISVGAYVYHCRQNTTAEDIEAPEN